MTFPELDQGFTDHLADRFKIVTNRKIDNNKLWEAFNDLQRSPQLARSLVERMVLHPTLSLEHSKEALLSELYNTRAYLETFERCSELEKLLLSYISYDGTLLFSENIRKEMAKKLGIPELTLPTMQSTLRVLQRKGLVGRFPERGEGYFIEDPNLKNWILELPNL